MSLVYFPDPILRAETFPVDPDTDLQDLVDLMIATMYKHDGIGLAAPQIGVSRRVVMMDVTRRSMMPRVFINPTIELRSIATCIDEEGCLSLPGARADVERAADIIVRYQAMDGREKVESLDGLSARCMQHEIDHLNGVLFIDHLSRLKRDRVVKKVQKTLGR